MTIMTADGKPVIYVGCALTHAPEAFKQDIEKFKDSLRPYAKVLDFLGQQHPNVEEVFETDIGYVRQCDLLIANITHPSIGLGVEFGVAVEKRKPIITLAQKDAFVSRFVYGYSYPLHFSYRYNYFEDAAEFVLKKLQGLFPQLTFAVK